jgi:hypothetical protein
MVERDWTPTNNSRKIKLLDFDWAGRYDQARYPAHVNHEGISRPEGAKDGEIITKDHDMEMVGYLS